MEKVIFKNNTKLPISIISVNTKEIAIGPYSEDWFRLPQGKSDITIETYLDGYTSRKENHIIYIREGVNQVNIQVDKILENKYAIVSLFCSLCFLIPSSFFNPVQWTIHLGFMSIDFVYIYWPLFILFIVFNCFKAIKIYKMMKSDSILFNLKSMPLNLGNGD